MYCQECEKNMATVHLTRIINNKKIEINLCEKCAKEKGDLVMFSPFSINDILSSFIEVSQGSSMSIGYDELLKCEVCNMTYDVFKRTGRLGCHNCYKAFEDNLLPLIKRIQAGIQHIGKFPKEADGKIKIKHDIRNLRTQLNDAVEKEEFEKAAELRDRIRHLENTIGRQ